GAGEGERHALRRRVLDLRRGAREERVARGDLSPEAGEILENLDPACDVVRVVLKRPGGDDCHGVLPLRVRRGAPDLRRWFVTGEWLRLRYEGRSAGLGGPDCTCACGFPSLWGKVPDCFFLVIPGV